MAAAVVPPTPGGGITRRTRNLLIGCGLLLLFTCLLCSLCSGAYYVAPWIQSQLTQVARVPPVPPLSTPVLAPTFTPAAPATPAPYPTAQPTVAPATGQVQVNPNGTVNLTVLNPTGAEQTQVRHPSAYHQTNVSGVPVKYILDIPAGYMGIVGGFNIDGTANGVYRGLGPGHFEVTIIDGFAEIVRDNWALEEWNFRIGEATKYNWAKQRIDQGPIK